MRDLVAARGLEALRACAALTLAAIPASAPPPRAALGFHSVVGCSWFGVGVAFGSASHETWLALAELAERFGNAELRLTPAREVLLTGVQSAQADELARDAHALGLITEKSDPRRRIVACSGAPACSSAYGDTRALASAIQPLLAAGATLHISGCGKGCASRASSDVSVVLAANGARLALNADIAAASCAPVEPLTTISAKLAALPGRSDTHDKVQR